MSETTLGQRIRERRKQLKMSQNALSKVAGVSYSSISLWENDNTAPRGENLHKLAMALQCSPTWVLYGDDEKAPELPRPPSELDSLSDEERELLNMYRYLSASEQQSFFNSLKARLRNFSRNLTAHLESRNDK
ncbi:helix-turn-helix domain-containing protein [Salmonella enterica]|uniref:helix-turn-helix domain-containing protein n=1 Tax=Salmonella enterica TaxID=28901 RepID=UPI001277847E|nr:helix-turn-helix domain-containing protein [Salmonella enterica]EEL8285069.1 helix-turn-helix domain-containing protein [Salmonella enterica subsp. enterica serovar Agona]ECC3821353.1 helix-turn-helix domain-containing protein [Salmonella enterica]ECC5260195.1 helix-turn-helix domain-containing protein [Salmonella enterica]EKN5490961.1 helix-turn-helix domain-containing protein [Salmonella enterica]MBH0545361.1 helix-turn-helix domain-containing protein [Salmonella enterica]